MPQAKPSPQHRGADHDMDEEALFRKLSKGQAIHRAPSISLTVQSLVLTDNSQICHILATRLDNLQLIRREWDIADAKVCN